MTLSSCGAFTTACAISFTISERMMRIYEIKWCMRGESSLLDKHNDGKTHHTHPSTQDTSHSIYGHKTIT